MNLAMLKPYFQPVVINGQTFDLAHLEPFSFEIDSERAKRRLRVHVTFTTHCFSQSYDTARHMPEDAAIVDIQGRLRVFCPVRYRLSFQLPDLIRGLCRPNVKVSETAAERNWCFSIRIEDPTGPYHVFFELRRAGADRAQHQHLNLVVESAYHEDPELSPPNLKGKMSFVLLCGKVHLHQPTSTGR